MAWHEPSVAVGKEFSPGAMAELRESPDRLHPGGEGMESRGGGNKLNSLSSHAPKPPVQPHIGKGPSVAWSIEVSLRALTEQGKKNGKLIWEEAEMACPHYCGESPRHVHSRGLRSSAWPLLGPVQMSLPEALRDEGEEAGWNPQRSSKGA